MFQQSSFRQSSIERRGCWRALSFSAALLTCTGFFFAFAQASDTRSPLLDSDEDGLSDALEQALLLQFAPHFWIGKEDCSHIPAEFQPALNVPIVKTGNGTIYGQVFPVKNQLSSHSTAEIHFYHLWKQDCGDHGHPLDAEHVSVLVRASGSELGSATWKASYWYAAAHENTVCDVSQIARAITIRAEDSGANVWISPNKHASYLNPMLCGRGCGADRCQDMIALPPGNLINLGEPGRPMNDSLFISSKLWPLSTKMTTSNFPAAPISRLDGLPATDIAWFNAGRHPAQGVIAISSTTEDALAQGGNHTVSAISDAEDSTGSALEKSYQNTVRALGSSARHVGHALHGVTSYY